MRSRVLVAAAAGLLAGAAVPTLAATTTGPRSASAASQVPAQEPTIGVVTVHGCYNSVGTMKSNGTLQWCTLGSCGQVMCRQNGWLVGATMGSNYCYCGNEYPNTANLVDDHNCNLTCAGDNTEICGGTDFYTVYNSGLNIVIPEAPADSSVLSNSSSTSSSSTATSATQSPQVATESSKLVSPPTKSSTNVAGIAAGVVVAVVLVALALGAMFFYMRRKRNTEIEAAHRSAAAASHLSPSHKSGGSTVSYDTRLEQDMVHRRMSSGSINDNEDYSRRILRVTNA